MATEATSEFVDTAKPSIPLYFIRHAESNNNEVYRYAKQQFKGGTPDFDSAGWAAYVDEKRSADPSLSPRGETQADKLADYLVPHLEQQASVPVTVLVSPMRRTLETIRPTLERIRSSSTTTSDVPKVRIQVCAYYHESEGCHLKDQAEEGMNPAEIRELMKDCLQNESDIEFIGFPEPSRGWYCNSQRTETREESQVRAAKFCLWFGEQLNQQILTEGESAPDLFDAGALMPGEENEDENDKFGVRLRKRRTVLLVGHGDFMNLTLNRLIAGFNHSIENQGKSNRSAFVHHNTGISELEFFGHGRYMVMCINSTPHLAPSDYKELRSGGTLRDGWGYILPSERTLLKTTIEKDTWESFDASIQEQVAALRSIYTLAKTKQNPAGVLFVVKRNFQVAGEASIDEATGEMITVSIQPSARNTQTLTLLFDAIKEHLTKLDIPNAVMSPNSEESRAFLLEHGFSQHPSEGERLML